MGLSWQQGPLSAGAIGHFLTPEPLPQRLLFAEWLRRRMRVKFNDTWIADSENVIVLHEPGRYRDSPYFPREDVDETALVPSGKITHHKDLGDTAWYTVHAGDRATERAAWEFTSLPGHAAELDGRIDFAWRAMDAFYEEADRILGHAADAYHRIDIRNTDRTLEVRVDDTVVARSEHPVVLYESGFAPAGTSRAPTSTRSNCAPSRTDLLSLQGPVRLLRHRRRAPRRMDLPQRLRRGRPDRGHGVVRAGPGRGASRRQAPGTRARAAGDRPRRRSRSERRRGQGALTCRAPRVRGAHRRIGRAVAHAGVGSTVSFPVACRWARRAARRVVELRVLPVPCARSCAPIGARWTVLEAGPDRVVVFTDADAVGHVEAHRRLVHRGAEGDCGAREASCSSSSTVHWS